MTYTERFKIGPSYGTAFVDDTRLVTVGRSRVLLWDTSAGAELHSGEVRDGAGLDVSPGGRYVGVRSTSGAVAIFGADDLAALGKMDGRGIGEGPTPRFAGDEELLVQAGWSGAMVVRTVPDGETNIEERIEGRQLTALCTSPDRATFFYAGASPKESIIWRREWPFDENGPEEVMRVTTRYHEVEAMAVSEAGQLAVQHWDRLSIWDIQGEPGPTKVAEWRGAPLGSRFGLAWGSSDEVAATEARGIGRQRVVVRSVAEESEWVYKLPYACSAAYSPSGRLLVLGAWKSGRVMERAD